MNGKVTCPDCGGRGWVMEREVGADYTAYRGLSCKRCRGSGIIQPLRTKVPTRRERLNAMSDEELAAWLIGIGFAERAEFCGRRPECEELLERDEFVPAEWCARCLAEWLGQEGELP